MDHTAFIFFLHTVLDLHWCSHNRFVDVENVLARVKMVVSEDLGCVLTGNMIRTQIVLILYENGSGELGY